MSWQPLGAIAPADLVDARLQLHHAAQVVASAGATFLEPRPDDSHPNLGWMDRLGALVGRTLPESDARAALRVADCTLLLVVGNDEVREALSLEGHTLNEGYAWLSEATARAGAPLPATGLTRVEYEIPSHGTAAGAPFRSTSGESFAEMSRWFANGHHALAKLASLTPGASEVRCWPHHFDLGALIVVETRADGSLAKSIGIGLSPGDESYAEPYAYVSPWPYPDATSLPPLGDLGHWHTDGYTSAILTGSALLDRSAEGQHQPLDGFLSRAVEASHRLLVG